MVHLVVVVLHIHICTNGSTPILIQFVRFFVVFVFIIRIRITQKWNLTLTLFNGYSPAGHELAWFYALDISLRLGTKHDVNGTSVGVPLHLCYALA